MLPSRGLRPAHFAPLAARQSLYARSNTSRQFSSIPRSTTLSATTRRGSQLHSATWRTGASRPHNVILSASTVRHGSWYAPWTWGSSNTSPANPNPTITPSEVIQPREPSAPEPTVTTATPELAPAGIDKAPVLESTTADTAAASQNAPGSVEELVDGILAANGVNPIDNYVGDGTMAIQKFGALKEMGLDFGWGPTALFEWLIEHTYIMSGMGWGASLVACTVLIRFVSFWTLQTKSSHNMAKMAAVAPLVQDLSKEMTQALQSGDDARNKVIRSKQAQIYKEVGVNPFMGLGPPLVQGIIGFGAFRCLRNMSSLPVPGMTQGGWLWFQDLTVADPYYILPVLSGGVYYLLFRAGGETGTSDNINPGAQFALKNILPVFMTAVTAFQPAGLQVYFVCTGILGAASAMTLRQEWFRRWMKLAPMPNKETKDLWVKVARGEVELSEVMNKDGSLKNATPKVIPTTISYQPPAATVKSGKQASRGPTRIVQNRGLNIKATSAVPQHLQHHDPNAIKHELSDRDHDYDSPPTTGVWDKLDWFQRNYRPKYVFNRTRIWMASVGPKSMQGSLLQSKKDLAKEKAKEYEMRRKERFNRR